MPAPTWFGAVRPLPAAATAQGRRTAPASAAAAVLVAAIVLAAVMASMTYSVVKYRWWIVAVYVGAGLLLAVRLVRDGGRLRLTRTAGALLLLACGAVTLTVRGYTYLPSGAASGMRVALATTATLAAGVLLVRRRRATDLALLIAALGYTAVVAALIRLDPAPRIDVWYTLQGFADALASGHNAYSQIWVGPPGPMQAFTYLPWTGALVAPGRWLLGDVRWALLVTMLLAALALRAAGRQEAGGTGTDDDRDSDEGSGRSGAVRGAAAAAILLLLPGSLTQAEQAWTEPILLACLAGAVCRAAPRPRVARGAPRRARAREQAAHRRPAPGARRVAPVRRPPGRRRGPRRSRPRGTVARHGARRHVARHGDLPRGLPGAERSRTRSTSSRSTTSGGARRSGSRGSSSSARSRR